MTTPATEEYTSHELLRLALGELVSQATLKDRLRNAAQYLLQLDAHDWPEKCQTEIRDLRRSLQTERALRGESAVTATIRKLSIQECESITKRLVELTFALLDTVPLTIDGLTPSPAVKTATNVDDSNIIPLFGEL